MRGPRDRIATHAPVSSHRDREPGRTMLDAGQHGDAQRLFGADGWSDAMIRERFQTSLYRQTKRPTLLASRVPSTICGGQCRGETQGPRRVFALNGSDKVRRSRIESLVHCHRKRRRCTMTTRRREDLLCEAIATARTFTSKTRDSARIGQSSRSTGISPKEIATPRLVKRPLHEFRCRRRGRGCLRPHRC